MCRYLPSGGTVAVAFILEIGHVLDQPLVDLGEGKSLFWCRLDSLGDEIRIRQISPRVASARVILGSRG